MGKPDSDPWLSLEIVRAELDVETAAQAKRAESADSRAGVLLGSSGALAGLAANTKSVFALPGAIVAVAAALLAAGVLLPQLQHVVDPAELRKYYLLADEERTKRAVLDRRVVDFTANVGTVDRKIKKLRRAVAAFTIAAVLVVGGFSAKLLIDAL